MPNRNFDAPASPGDMTDEELEIAQWRVDATKKGIRKVEEIYDLYWETQDNKKYFGKVFKAAVEGRRLTNISVLKHSDGEDFLSSDRQVQYVIV